MDSQGERLEDLLASLRLFYKVLKRHSDIPLIQTMEHPSPWSKCELGKN